MENNMEKDERVRKIEVLKESDGYRVVMAGTPHDIILMIITTIESFCDQFGAEPIQFSNELATTIKEVYGKKDGGQDERN